MAAGAGAALVFPVVADAVEGRGEKENPEPAGFVAVEPLGPKEKLGVLVAAEAGVLLEVVDVGWPKLKLEREVDCCWVALVEGDEAPFVVGLNGVALLFRLLDVAELAVVDEEEFLPFSKLPRCLRYWSRNDSMSGARSPNGSASSCSLIF